MNFLQKLKSLLRQKTLDADMTEEMRQHLERRTQANLAAGMSPDEARYAAQRQFGGVDQLKEVAREQRGWFWLEQTLGDLRYAARALRKAPGFTFAVMATLAVGIGLVTAIVSVTRPILWPSWPFKEAERLVVLRERSSRSKGYTPVVAVRFTEYAKHATTFAGMGAEGWDLVNLVVGGQPSLVRTSLVTEGFFPALGVAVQQGRLFASDEYQPAEAGGLVVLSDSAWRKFFGRDPGVVGKDVMLGDRLRRVVGVLAPGFNVLPTSQNADGIYLATTFRPGATKAVSVIGRLKPGVSLAQANAELRTIHPDLAGPPSENSSSLGPGQTSQAQSNLEPSLMSLADSFRENRAQPFRIFLGAAAALYLIGCTTVANLMLSRAVGRRRELGVRLALGGTRGRIVRLIVTEALLLALGGAGAAVVLAGWAQSILVHLAPAGIDLSEALSAGFWWRTAGIALALGVPTCVLAAIIPARGAGRIALSEALKDGAGAKGESRQLRWLRGAFVVTQSALAVALLVGAGLLLRTVGRLQSIEVGFDPAHKFVLSGFRLGAIDRTKLAVLNAEIGERIAALPGVARVAHVGAVPLAGSSAFLSVSVEGRIDPTPVTAFGFSGTADYFEAMEIPIVVGTSFAGRRAGGGDIAIINESMVRECFPNENPLGRHLLQGQRRLEIVGVVRDVATGERGVSSATVNGGKPMTAQIYLPSWQAQENPLGLLNVVVRLQGAADAGFAAAVRRAVFSVDPSVLVRLSSLETMVGEWSRTERQALVMLQVLSGLALGLAAFGTFSVMGYTVAQRRGELGLRLVLGATPGQLMAFVLKRGVLLGAFGIVIGVGLAAGSSKFIGAVLYQTSPHEPAVYAGVAGLLLAVTVLACWLPARRAAKVDPMVALRCE